MALDQDAGHRGSPLQDFDLEEDNDNFEDAAEEPAEHEKELHGALAECEQAMRSFFNNDLETAMSSMSLRSRTSLYHSLGVSIFEFIPAVLTLDSAQVTRALGALKRTLTLCQQYRRSYTLAETLGTIISKANYSAMSDLEAHAELCYAEAMLLQAALSVLDGEDFAAYLKAIVKVRTCYNTYRECSRILWGKTWETGPSRDHFHSGVRLGLATFSVMIAMLPPRLVTLLEFVGFSGDKESGLAELQAGARAPGLRGVLCELTLLAYHLVVSHFAGATPDFDLCRRILETQLKVYPEGVWFLLFEGRLQLLSGRCAAAAATYQRAAQTPHLWRQLRHLCYWELMWANATAPQHRQRIAGKSLPMEKWVLRRCWRFEAQRTLLMPATELLCLWNMLPALAADTTVLHSLLKEMEAADALVEGGRLPRELEGDNRALLALLRGTCLAALAAPRLALHHLEHVTRLKDRIKEDSYLVPYALVEAAMCHYALGDADRAERMLNDTRKRYSNYALESRLQFRIHSKLQIIRDGKKSSPGGSGSGPPPRERVTPAPTD